MSPQILRTTRSLPTEALTFEPSQGFDGEGKPSYGSSVSFEANVLEYDAGQFGQGSEFLFEDDGSRIHVPLTLYVPGDETDVPNRGDRITRGGETFIVVERKTVSGLRRLASAPDHHRIRVKDE